MAGFGIFIPIGIIIYFLSGDSQAFIMSAFGIVPAVYLLYRVLSPGSEYSVGRDGVFLRNGSYKRLIPLSEVRGAAVLSEEQARDILSKYMFPSVESERERDIKQWYKSNKAYGCFTGFCTVPIVQEHVSAGNEINIVKFGTKVTGQFVIIKLVSGEEFLISPEDCSGFYEALSVGTNLEDTNPTTSYNYSMDINRKQKLRKFFRWYRIIGAVAILAVAAVLLINNLEQVPAEDTDGWIDADTYRLSVTAGLSSGSENPDEREQELYQAVSENYVYSFISTIIAWYCREEGFDPDEEQYDALHDALLKLINKSTPVPLSKSINDDVTEIVVVIELSEENFQATVRSVLKQAIGDLQQ